jgi:tRNA (cmo5U34)-methyltransferase
VSDDAFSQGRSDEAAWVGFDWSRERYEDLIHRVIPDYDLQDGMIAEAVRGATPAGGGAATAPFRMLDLGAGTGSLSRCLLQTYPGAVVTALDISPAMLVELRRTLAPFGGRARVVEADLATVDLVELWRAAAESSGSRAPAFDASVSRLAIHHLDAAGQEGLLRRVFAALRPGGVFVNSDMIDGEDDVARAAIMDDWRRYMRARGDDPDEWERWLVGDDDHPATERTQLAWLRSAGFSDVQTIWKVAGFAMFRAVRAPGA